MTEFDAFRLSDDHRELQQAVRAVCADKVAPHAAEVDERGEFGQASYDALRAADFIPTLNPAFSKTLDIIAVPKL